MSSSESNMNQVNNFLGKFCASAGVAPEPAPETRETLQP